MTKQVKCFNEQEISELLVLIRENELKIDNVLTKTQLDQYMLENNLSLKGFGRRLSTSIKKGIVDSCKLSWAHSQAEFFDYLTSSGAGRFKKQHVCFECQECGAWLIRSIGSLLKKDENFRFLCKEHYFEKTIYAVGSIWRQNNREAQLIAQNRPDVQEKQQKSQKKRHAQPGMREKYQKIAKKLWSRESYVKKHQESMEKFRCSDRYVEIINNSRVQPYSGVYDDLQYQSLLELAFILWRKSKNDVIERSCHVVPYHWEDRERRYFPDFICNGTAVIEVKGRLWRKGDSLDKINAKHDALIKYCKSNNLRCRLVWGKDIPTQFKKAAKRIDRENRKEKDCTAQGKSL